jgi:tRNA pseudouridine38-40 synthase
VRVALGVSYRGTAYQGWQSQPGGRTVQDQLELALAQFIDAPVRVMCAGRTDAGVHALNQVVHLDCEAQREPFSWLRGTNRFLPEDIAVQWCRPVEEHFHARNSARGRRYVYVLRESPVRASLEAGLVGWSLPPARRWRHCQARLCSAPDRRTRLHGVSRSAELARHASPVKTDSRAIQHRAARFAYWRFEFDANAFLHHMVRNIIGCLIVVGSGRQPPGWMAKVLAARDRDAAAPTFGPEGLYFLGPYYDAALALPEHTPAHDWLP